MSTEQSKSVIRRFGELVDAGDLDGAFALCTSDFVDHGLPPGTPPGAESSWQFLRAQYAAFPDLHATVLDLFAEGDRVASRMELEGTHQGPMMGIPPTGKHAKWGFIFLHRIVDGMIAEHWVVSDTMGLMQQLGLIPPHRTT